MIIRMKKDATAEQIGQVAQAINDFGMSVRITAEEGGTLIAASGCTAALGFWTPEKMAGVEAYDPQPEPIQQKRVVDVGGVKIGGDEICVMAGPCAIESKEQVFAAAKAVSRSGARFLRGGAYKPRTSPYAFQGLEEEGLVFLRWAADKYGLKTISEVMSEQQIDLMAKYCDMLQIGARNMQNFPLLEAVGRSGKPVLLKRGFSSTVAEWLDAAEYILKEGNRNVVLCERGIRTFETATRSTLDIGAVTAVRLHSPLPVLVDPSHAAGCVSFVEPLALAGIAAGADGLMVEVHPEPPRALSDATQQLTPEAFEMLMHRVRAIAPTVGRTCS